MFDEYLFDSVTIPVLVLKLVFLFSLLGIKIAVVVVLGSMQNQTTTIKKHPIDWYYLPCLGSNISSLNLHINGVVGIGFASNIQSK